MWEDQTHSAWSHIKLLFDFLTSQCEPPRCSQHSNRAPGHRHTGPPSETQPSQNTRNAHTWLRHVTSFTQQTVYQKIGILESSNQGLQNALERQEGELAPTSRRPSFSTGKRWISLTGQVGSFCPKRSSLQTHFAENAAFGVFYLLFSELESGSQLYSRCNTTLLHQ